jgi:hypothetical protein
MSEDQQPRQMVDPETHRRHERQEKRWLLAISVGTPVLLILTLALEEMGGVDFTPGYDLSAAAVTVVSCLCVIAGITIIITGIRRGRSGLYPIVREPKDWGVAMRDAYGRRLSGAVLIAVGWLVASVSTVVLLVHFNAI